MTNKMPSVTPVEDNYMYTVNLVILWNREQTLKKLENNAALKHACYAPKGTTRDTLWQPHHPSGLATLPSVGAIP